MWLFLFILLKERCRQQDLCSSFSCRNLIPSGVFDINGLGQSGLFEYLYDFSVRKAAMAVNSGENHYPLPA
jgi:hypothetical protein